MYFAVILVLLAGAAALAVYGRKSGSRTGGAAVSFESLIRKANRAFTMYLERQGAHDFSGASEALEKLQSALQELAGKAGGAGANSRKNGILYERHNKTFGE